MHKTQELRSMLCNELDKYGAKNNLNASELDVVDKLAHAIKNLDKIIEKMGYSMDYDYSMRSYPMGTVYDDRKRDYMGRYSRDNSVAQELREIMNSASDERTRQALQRIISQM